MFPTLDEIKSVLEDEYSDPHLTEWASYLHEQWHTESLELHPILKQPMRFIIFGGLAHKLFDKYHKLI